MTTDNISQKQTEDRTAKQPSGPKPALVVAAHGTRDKLGAETAFAFVEKVQAAAPDVKVVAGFVELTPPTIAAALTTYFAEHGTAGGAVIVPLMIGSGGHVRDDIPESVAEAQAAYPEARMVISEHLGAPEEMVSAATQRAVTAQGEWEAADTNIVFVGRGCSITDTNADHARLARVVQERGSFARVIPAYIQVVEPSLPNGLDDAYAMGARKIVVLPHFLFPGVLLRWVHEQTGQWQAEHPDAQVRIADVLGPCPELVATVLARYEEAQWK